MLSTSSEISRNLQSEDGGPPHTITDMMPTNKIETFGNDQHVINIGLHDVKDNAWKLRRKRKVTLYGKINADDLPIRGAR